MGVKELTRFIEPCGILTLFDDYQSQYVAVDILQVIYKYCIRNNIEGNFNKPLKSIINYANKFIKHNIIPIFIFDGSSIQMKVRNKMKKSYETSDMSSCTSSCVSSCSDSCSSTCSSISDSVSADSCEIYEKRSKFKITPQQIKECEELIHNLGFPCFRAPHEADPQCAALTKYKIVQNDKEFNIDVVFTDDTDTLVFGAKSIIKMLPIDVVNNLRNIFNIFLDIMEKEDIIEQKYSIRKIINIIIANEVVGSNYEKIVNKINLDHEYNFAEIIKFSNMENILFAVKYDLSNIIKYLNNKAEIICNAKYIKMTKNFDVNNFIDMCILFGTDYQNRIDKMTIEEIFEQFVLAEYDIKIYINNISKYVKIPENYLENIEKIREYYINATVYNPNLIDIIRYKPNVKNIFQILVRNGFNVSFINRISKIYEENFMFMYKKIFS